jgi:hypothetical protein
MHGTSRAISSKCGDCATPSGAPKIEPAGGMGGGNEANAVVCEGDGFANGSTLAACYVCGPESEISRSARKTLP